MALLLNHVNAGLRIFIPATGEVRQFDHGSLVIEEDDPAYGVVMAEALANPNITVVMGGSSGNVVAKASAPHACDACNPAQSFDSDEALSAHVGLVHLARPTLNEEGEVQDQGDAPRTRRRRGEVEGIPPATAGRSG